MATRAEMVSPLMVVEDSDEDFEALSRILRTIGFGVPIRRCVDGDECLTALGLGQGEDSDRHDPWPFLRPFLILMDLNLPGTNGRETLRMIKTDLRLKTIPVTVLTTSASQRDVQTCYEYGANAYLLKSIDYDELAETLRTAMDFWLRAVVLPEAVL